MAAQSILGRITQMARANINSILDQVEDPQVMIDQMIRDYTSSITEAENAVAQTIGNLRMIEEDAREADTAAKEWGAKASAASARADELRTESNAAEADKFDNLARVALGKQLAFEGDATEFAPVIAEQTEVTEKLKAGLTQMRGKLDELKRKRDELVGRAKVNDARARVQDAVKNINVLDPTTEIGRFEEKIRREEARLRGQEEMTASSIDAQFESLDDLARDSEVEARLKKLKVGAGRS
ncbi:phage shock protein A [Allocatelliglobosispora scoriae]|uniref:Phage shock protein A n=1 Tax=Allocatelliglobosispora scoriae TaxID=643052 RepID=A0A841BT60_9ACTN|nr:PspA/IM30 family protein [Allocatelliglobosispora scoriae]MBB5870598.1 phage shock protein A [Allocatelliglobosispora scoriae]